MSSASRTPARVDKFEQQILDAAYAQVMAVGFRRTTMTDIAERAGLSRMTVYRRFPDVTSVLQALMTREFGAILGRARIESARIDDPRERIVAEAVRGLDLLATHELWLRLLDTDPELLLPYLTQRLGQVQDAAVGLLAAELADAMAAGAVRRDEPRRLAITMIMAMRGYAYAAGDGTSRRRRRLLLKDLERMLDGLLRPEG
jgi:AcrR family transcriptional regulator